MKKSLLFKALIAVMAGCMVACTPKPASSSSATPTPSSSESGEISSSESSSEHKEKGDENWVDYVNDGTVQLGLNYVGKDFYVDGIGQFTLKTAIDGDTAHFTPLVDSTHSGTMKARFYGIDTPESTGKVQDYGKAASRFTKEQLKEANEHGTIVISSAQNEYGEPQPDSTGSRYVSLVWINLTKKNAPMDELILLNLWIVQEGLSWVKNVNSMPQYVDTFYNAQNQARDYELYIHSGLPDPDRNYGAYEDVSLLDIREEIAACLADPDHQNLFDNAKLRIQGTVAGFSNHILYLEDYYYYDEDHPELGGEYCGINIFCGMGEIPSKYTKLNSFIQVCGLAQQTDNYGFQVTDVYGFPTGSPLNESDSQVIFKPEENVDTEHNLYTFEYTKSGLSSVCSATNPYNLECLNCRVLITETLTVNRVFISDSTSKEVTLYFEGCSFNVYVAFNYKGDPSRPNYRWILEEDFLGKKFNVTGIYVHHKTTNGRNTFQVIPTKTAELEWVQEG